MTDFENLRELRRAPGLLACLICAAACQGQTWTTLGPSPLVGAAGPTGRIKAVAVDPSDPTHWLLGAASGGVWESHDSGANWNPISDSQPNLNIGSVTFAPGNSNIIYAGTGEATWAFAAHPGQGILKSVDGGATWSLLGSSTFTRTSVGAIRVDPKNPDNVVAVMSRGNSGRLNEQATEPAPFGLQRSSDGGVTWTRKIDGESTALEVDPANFNHQYAGMGLPAGYGPFNTPAPSGLYRSLDAGQTWAIVTGPWNAGNVGRFAIAVAPDSNTVYVSVQGASDIGGRLLGLYRTDNAWDLQPAWIQIPIAINWSTPGCANCVDYCGPQCTSLTSLSVDPSDPSTLFVGGISLWRCDHCDTKASWTNIGVDGQDRSILPLNKRCLAWAGGTLLAGTDQGLFSTATGSSPWQDNNGGLSVARFMAGGLHPADPNSALGGTLDATAALWPGSLSWQALSTGQAEAAFSSANPSTSWMVATASRILRTLDGGRTFSAADGGVDFTGAAPVIPVKQCPAANDVFLTGSNRLFRGNNFFQPGSPSWSANGPSGAAIASIAFSPADTGCNTYAYGTMSGLIQVTTDGGNTWTNLDPGQTLPVCGTLPGYCARAASSLAFDPNAPKTLYVALSGFNENTAKPGHLFKTLDWTAAAPVWLDVSPPVNLPHNVVALDPSNANSVYAGTDAGVWYSANAGAGWSLLGPASGLPSVPVFDLKINPGTNRIVAFTFGRGAYALDNSTPSPGLTLSGVAPSLQAMLGSAFSLTLSAGGTSPLTFSIGAGTLPTGLVLLPSGTIQGTALGAGAYTFTVLVKDGNGGMASQTITMTVGTNGTAPVWSSLGPLPLGYVNCPTNPTCFNSGRVASIAVDPSDPGHWLIGVGNGGVWETHDTGTSWIPLSDTWPTLSIGAVAFAPGNPGIIYVGTGEPDPGAGGGFGQTGLGIMKSTDAGKTWNLLAVSSFARATVKRIRVHPTNPDVVLAATSRGGYGRDSQEGAPSPPPFGILRSSDGGTTWLRTLNGQATAIEIDPTNFNNQYVAIGEQRVPNGVNNDSADAVPNGVYRSTDGGQTWSSITGPWGTSTKTVATVGRIELALAPSNPGVLYASIQVPPNGGSSGQPLLGLYRTDNAWAANPTWIQVPTSVIPNGAYCGPQKCGYSHVISVSPSDPNVLFAGGGDDNGFWRCTNCGSSPAWTRVDQSFGVHPDPHSTAWVGNRFILGNDGGVWSTLDLANSWQDHNATLSTAMFYTAALHPTDENFILGGLRDFQISLRTAVNIWGIFALPSSTREWGEAEVAVSSSRPATDWMANHCCDGTISRTTDGGQTSMEADAGIDKTGIAFVAPVRKCPDNDDVFLTGTNRIWRTDGFFSSAAPTWVANGPVLTGQNGGPSTFPNSPATILEIEFVPSDATCRTYVLGNRGGRVQVTSDGGSTWTDLDPARTLPPRPVNGLAFDPTNPNILYAALSSFDDATPGKPGHVFKTTNALSASPAWTNVSPPLNEPFNVIRVDPSNPASIYAGSDTGLWRSSDGAATWTRQVPDLGIPNAPVYDIKINPATGRTAVFTYGRGAYTLGPELYSAMASPDGGVTYGAGPLVPGAWASVQGGQLAGMTVSSDPDNPPTTLSGAGVQVNGIPALVCAVSPAQIVFQVPAGVTSPATVQVFRDGIPSNSLTVAIGGPEIALSRPRTLAPASPKGPFIAKIPRYLWMALRGPRTVVDSKVRQ